jgi:hypothetical protein
MLATPISVKVLTATRPLGQDRYGLITLEAVMPAWAQRESLTHGRISRNWSSMRAMSLDRNESMGFYIPPVFYKKGTGMMAGEPLENQEEARRLWISASDRAVEDARALESLGMAKEQYNRVIGDYRMMRGVMTATESGWQAFLGLRLVPNTNVVDRAMHEVALRVKEAIDGVKWRYATVHAPMADYPLVGLSSLDIAAARMARGSYGQPKAAKTDPELARSLKENRHWSPFEHIATWTRVPLPSRICSLPDDRMFVYGWSSYRVELETNLDPSIISARFGLE